MLSSLHQHFLYKHFRQVLAAVPSDRLLALDVLRGLTITAMILVNNPGSWQYIYAPLRHASWHGWTVTDLIFPFFIVIVGISLQLNLGRQPAVRRASLLLAAFRRGLILVLLGLFLALFYIDSSNSSVGYLQHKLDTLRWPGVLQRIGVVYFITVLIVLTVLSCSGRTAVATVWRIGWFVGLCALYLLAMWYWPYADATGQRYQGLLAYGNNFAAWLDTTVLGASHVYYKNATPFAFDPEGLWTTLPAIASCLSGVLLAQWLQSARTLAVKISVMLLVGAVAVLLAEWLHTVVPINKYLWTPSFVLLSTGYCSIALALCLWLCDVKQHRLWAAPFVVFGANALLFFMLAGIAARVLAMIPVGSGSLQRWLFGNIYQPLLGNYPGSLAYAVSFLVLSYLLMYGCYRRGIFFKV